MKLIIDISEETCKEIRLHGLSLPPAYSLDLAKALKKAKEVKIKDLSDAEKKGKWIAYKGMQIPERHGLHYCSNCHHSLHLASNGRVYNYCPRCGAKMEVIE